VEGWRFCLRLCLLGGACDIYVVCVFVFVAAGVGGKKYGFYWFVDTLAFFFFHGEMCCEILGWKDMYDSYFS